MESEKIDGRSADKRHNGIKENLTWDESVQMAALWEAKHRHNDGDLESSQISQSIAFNLRPMQAAELGENYGQVITAVELYAASRDPSLRNNVGRAVGRAKGPRYRLRALKEQMGCAGPLELTCASAEARTWAQLSGKLRLLQKVRKQKTSIAIRQTAEAGKAIKAALHMINKFASDANDLRQLRISAEWSRALACLETLPGDVLEDRIEQASNTNRQLVEKAARDAKRASI